MTARTTRFARNHAVVIGGSIAGLLAARVLADHFQRVTIVEQDEFPAAAPAHRRGVPQSPHLHILLMRGQAIFEALFPGLRQQLLDDGAPQIDSAQDLLWLNPAGWGARYPSGLTKLAFSRDLLDWHVRQRVDALVNVTFMPGTSVLELTAGPSGVSGVRTSTGVLEADLVVDASGRGSRAPRWLEALGYPMPTERVVDAHIGYASRVYRQSSHGLPDWRGVYVQSAPPRRNRGGVLFTVEGNRWLVTLVGAEGEQPPTDETGFVEFARSLPTPLLFDTIRTAEPLSEIVSTRSGENRLRPFHLAARWPAGFVVLGDAACAFNPVYGQGMTVAALETLALAEGLRQPRFDAPAFQRTLAKIVALPWSLATSEDSRYPSTQGAILDRQTRFLHGYMDHVLALATEHASVRGALLQVQHMLRPPTALFAPSILARVALRAVSGSGGTSRGAEVARPRGYPSAPWI